MGSIKTTAKTAGILYFVTACLMIFGYMYVPTLFSGDAATTARKITGSEGLYRITVLISFASQILFIFVGLTLYKLFRDVDRNLARMMLALLLVGVTAEIVNIAGKMSHLEIAANADFQAAFTKPQREALADGVLVMGNNLGQFLTMFWGLWLFPFGLLVMKSGFLPRILGVLLLAAGLGYVVTCVTYILAPGSLPAVSTVMKPLYFGEVPIILWLLVMGAKEPATA